MGRKIYLEFQLTEFNDNIFGFQVRYQDPRFNRVNYGDIRSNSNVSLATFPQAIFLKGNKNHDTSDFSAERLTASKSDILKCLEKFPAHELFKDDFKSDFISLQNCGNDEYVFYHLGVKESILTYKLWDNEHKKFFQILHQDDKLTGGRISFNNSGIIDFNDSRLHSTIFKADLHLRGKLKELDFNVDWTSQCEYSIEQINQLALRDLNEFYGNSECNPKIQEIGKDIYQVYCEV